jgi:hypothetical protein
MDKMLSTDFIALTLMLGLLYAVLWIWAIIDLLRADFKDSNMKIIWAVVLIFANPIGPFVYFMISKEQKSSPRKYFNTKK